MKGLFSCRSGGAMTALWLGSTGMIGPDTLALFLIGLPALAVSAPRRGSNCSASSTTRRFVSSRTSRAG